MVRDIWEGRAFRGPGLRHEIEMRRLDVGGAIEFHAPRFVKDGYIGSRPALFCSIAEPDPDLTSRWRARLVAEARRRDGRVIRTRPPGRRSPSRFA